MGRAVAEDLSSAPTSMPLGSGAMSATQFVRKWGPRSAANRLNERQGAQAHFMDLCQLLGVPTPSDPERYCFERGFRGAAGDQCFADVWKKDCFAWEYKTPGGDLSQALAQLMRYALPLENPPLLVVSDRLRIQLHTHFTGRPSTTTSFMNEDLQDSQARALLRDAFVDPYRFRPEQDCQQITGELAAAFATIADRMRARGVPSGVAAHFLTQCLFCFFAQDLGALPNKVFTQLVCRKRSAADLRRLLAELFDKMRVGGTFGVEDIPWFNGGLFSVIEVPELQPEDVAILARVSNVDWKAIDPSILGVLFERGLDPRKRSQLGTHFTDAATIMRVVEPVLVRPLREEWARLREHIGALMSKRDFVRVRAKGIPSKREQLKDRYYRLRTEANRAEQAAQDLFAGFLERLRTFRVLDPACGSGNFLFLALKALKDVEDCANADAERMGLHRQLPVTGPHNLLGIEVSEFAAELARATVWIGELQWGYQHGLGWKENPVLDPLDQIECRDALIDSTGAEARWPQASVIVGNPPFLGTKKQWRELGVPYVDRLRAVYGDRVPGFADLVCYWFEKARSQISTGEIAAAGLVATNSIRGGANRAVLDRITKTASIFSAWSDLGWVNEGASVHVSLICFAAPGTHPPPELDGQLVASIHADLTADANLTDAKKLPENLGTAFMATVKAGPLEIDGATAREWLKQPNPAGQSNATVVKPWANGMDVVRRPSDTWVIDFGVDMNEEEAALFEAPFAHAHKFVKPARATSNRAAYRTRWWLMAEPTPKMRQALEGLPRYIATPVVSKHRLFVWLPSSVLADHALIVTARSDDATFGVLQSRFHELWSLRLGTSLEDRPRYTPTTTFETFPFPAGLTPIDTANKQVEHLVVGGVIPSGVSPALRASIEAIAIAAKRLNDLREGWLNPPEWSQRVSDVVPRGADRSPYPDRIVAIPGFEKQLAQRTLTNLYNQRPHWLERAHVVLDEAVAAAYGWSDYRPEMPAEDVLRRLLAINAHRAA